MGVPIIAALLSLVTIVIVAFLSKWLSSPDPPHPGSPHTSEHTPDPCDALLGRELRWVSTTPARPRYRLPGEHPRVLPRPASRTQN